MSTVQIATRIDNADKQLFENTTKKLGITPDTALKIFIAKFNAEQGFPFEVKQNVLVDGFIDEGEMLDFISEVGGELYDH